jgi:hypothetical protein
MNVALALRSCNDSVNYVHPHPAGGHVLFTGMHVHLHFCCMPTGIMYGATGKNAAEASACISGLRGF